MSDNLALKLSDWYGGNKRVLPWRSTDNPYFIWLSEIILQQTRVEQGLPYYEKFVTRFPNVKELAAASLDDVYKLWEGLGYYSRARNLHKTANVVVNDYSGLFPDTYSELIKLPGIGDYTASAVASFAFNEVKPVLDGNVFRVVSRVFGVEDPINKQSSRSVFKTILYDVIDEKNPADFNQAIMEFGALHCKPKNPLCGNCPFADRCIGYNYGKIDVLPRKIKAKKSIDRFFNYLIIREEDSVFLVKREGRGIWSNLHEFPLIESKELFEIGSAFKDISVVYESVSSKHVLSHQNIYAKFYVLNSFPLGDFKDVFLVKINELTDYAMHRLMTRFLDEDEFVANHLK